MGDLYGHGEMRGPFDFGCLLTLSSRREGYPSAGMLTYRFSFTYLTLKSQMPLLRRRLSLLKRIQKPSVAWVPLLLPSGTMPKFRIASISIKPVCHATN